MSHFRSSLVTLCALAALGVSAQTTSTPVEGGDAASAPVAPASATAKAAIASKPVVAARATSARAPAASAPVKAKAVNSKRKEELVQRLLQLWHVENVGLTMLEGPISDAIRQARAVLQARVSSEKQTQALKDIDLYAKDAYTQNAPVVLERAKALAKTTVAPLLMEKFTEDELSQLVAMYESPVKLKFEGMIPELQSALGVKLGAEQGPKIRPKLEELQKRIGERLRDSITP